ncbi:substrate-binding domain-containing protein [Nocardioidaceae bacterium SCSIO 66511]|nr:substrate-binding domain-containing protein [Nocardioidaceae bacterium SCSIO 66511]
MPVLAVAGLLGASMALTACGSDDDGGGGSGGGEAAGKVGVILPDTESSARWVSGDPPALKKAFEDAGVDAVIENAQGDSSRMTGIADSMISDGVTVLAIVNLDNESGAAIQEKAESQGVATIDYDRLTLGGSASYYVSYDGFKVGQVQGEGLQQCLGKDTKANIAYLNGSPDDSNATLFSNGAHDVLDKNSNYNVVAEQAVPAWDNTEATKIFEQMWTQNQGKIDGVLAANDGLAGSVISILDKNDAAGDVPVTGQDATVQGLQDILTGDQCMTVYKSAPQEANALADVAIAMANGDEPETNAESDDAEGDRKVPSILLDPLLVTKDNVKEVVDDGGVDAAELCKGFEQECKQAGIDF